jgi:hypothetical protein
LGNAELGVESQFQQVSVEELTEQFKTAGLPPHLAIATGELCGALGFEEAILTTDEIIQARDVSVTQPERRINLTVVLDHSKGLQAQVLD